MDEFLAIYSEHIAEWTPPLLRAAVVTLQLAGSSIAVGLVLGLVVALMRISPVSLFRRAAIIYIETVRGTPALAMLYLIYFGLPSLGITLDRYPAAVAALGINAAAYMAEIYRAGIQSVHRGQREAALSIGMTPLQAMRHIVLPQAWRVVLPPGANLGVAVLKDTSLASVIAAPELMSRAYDLVGQSWRPMHIYLIVAVLYAAMCLPLGRLARRLELAARRGDRDAPTVSGAPGLRQRLATAWTTGSRR